MTTALLLKIGADASAMRGDLAKASSMMNQFTGQMAKIGSAIAGAFAVSTISNFAFEASKLAAEAEGVSSAFGKIQNSTKLLDDMTKATEHTVDSLTLMKLGVSALNNQVPLQNLAEILGFIDKTADATGQNFKELSETIIRDIGKGSTRGLNELGLSLETIKTRTKEIGFVPSVLEEVRRKSAELGDVSSVTADSYDRLEASLTNFKIAIGNFINQKGVSNAIDLLSEFINLWSPGVAQAAFDMKVLQTAMDRFNDSQPEGKDFLDFYSRLEGHARKAGKELLLLTDEATGLRKVFIKPTPITLNTELDNTPSKIEKIKHELDSLTRKAFEAPIEVKPLKNVTGSLIDPKALTATVQSSVSQIQPAIQSAQKSIGEYVWALQNGEIAMLSFQEAWANVGKVGIDATDLINQGLTETSAGIGVAIGDILSGAGGFENIGAVLLTGIANMMMQLGQLAIGAGIAIEGIKKALTSLNPAVAIAGGVALIALSRVISNKASSIGRGGTGGSGGLGSSSQGGALTKIQYGNRIKVEGQFELRGDVAVALVKNQERRDDRTLPTRR